MAKKIFRQKRNKWIAEVGMKKCSRCKGIKKVETFNKDSTMVNGYRSYCRDCGKKYYKENSKKINEINKKWRDSNPEKNSNASRNWRNSNIEKSKEIIARSVRKRYGTIKGKLSMNMSGRIRGSLKSGKEGHKWVSLTGYTVSQLKKHLESLFQEGMTWANHTINGWHIDHILPIASFNYKTYNDEEFKQCWSLKNLQPLWAKDNRRKYSKIMEEI